MLILISGFSNIYRSNSLKAVAGDLRHFGNGVNIFYRKSLLSIRKINFAAFLHSQLFHCYMIIRKVLVWKARHTDRKLKKCNDSSLSISALAVEM
jgi:hypothetical protein